MVTESEINKWRASADHRKKRFERTGNIHDLIDYKKKCWLIEGYTEGIRVSACDVETLTDEELLDQFYLFYREICNRDLRVNL